ncbi:MAG: MBL fold metallo-hydrolase [Conexivisphaerales archaeon]
MSVSKIDEHIFMIDVEVAGIQHYIASYVLMGEKIAIIETGPASSIQNLIRGLISLGIKPGDVSYIAVSHIHLDHSGGVGALVKHLPKAKVIVHEKGAPHLVNPEKLWQHSQMILEELAEVYGKLEPVPADQIIAAKDGMTFEIGKGITLQVMETLGHASHHLSYYETQSNGIFVGDAAGMYLNDMDVIVPTTPPPFRLDLALASLKKLADLGPSVLYYTHFGKAKNATKKLHIYIDQLRLWANIAKQSLDKCEDLEKIGHKITENDGAIKKALEYIKAHKILNKTVLKTSVLGMVEFVKNFGLPF